MLTPQQQHRLFQLGMDRFEYRLRVKAGAARNAFLRAVAKAYADGAHIQAHAYLTHRARVGATLQAHYGQVTEYFGRLALSGIEKGRKAALTPVQALVLDWVRLEALRKAQMIADTDRDDVAGAIEKGVAEGLGAGEIATSIRRLTQLTPWKAATVARTETHAAATYGSITSAREAETSLDMQLLKAWLPTMDDRTRPDHAAMAGSDPIPMDAKFLVGGVEMDRPGDPSALAEQVVNCRCSLVYQEA
jgi:uncharacterized protein with gpF-like domain